MARGFVYLVAVMDWHSRRVLARRVSNSMESGFCVEAVEEALARFGAPRIFNTDQGSQFTSEAFTGLLKKHAIQINMDGKGCWRGNVFVERLRRTVKYEEVYLHVYESVPQARESLVRYCVTSRYTTASDRTRVLIVEHPTRSTSICGNYLGLHNRPQSIPLIRPGRLFKQKGSALSEAS